MTFTPLETVGISSLTPDEQTTDTSPEASVAPIGNSLLPADLARFAEETISEPRRAHAAAPAPVPAADMDGDGIPEIAVYLGCFRIRLEDIDEIVDDFDGGDPETESRVRTVGVARCYSKVRRLYVLTCYNPFVDSTLSYICIIYTGVEYR